MTPPPETPPSPRWQSWDRQLYVRIWLAMLATFTALLVLVAWAWSLAQVPPLREVLVRDETGEVIGRAVRQPPHPSADTRNWLPSAEPAHTASELSPAGPEFLVHLDDGQELFIQLPRPPARTPFGREADGFLWLLALVGLAAALATYPIIKRLTRRLGSLQRAVEQFGRGDLSARVALDGDDEVGRLSRRFNWAAGRIEALLTGHKALLANASHELRTPLARLRMGLTLMQADPHGPHAAQNAHEIERSITELDQLIDEILLASRLDAQVADMGTVEPIDLIGLVAEECAHSGAPCAFPHGAQPIVVLGVDKLLRRVVRNLLENARRYSPGAPDVTLALDPFAPAGPVGHAVLSVADRGPGVPPAQRTRIFEPFHRLPGASESSGGVGLGLALVRSIVTRMRGTVHCEDNPGGGACFVVRLPLAPAQQPGMS